MKRITQFLGIAGLVFLLFALILAFLIEFDPYHLTVIHFTLGGVSLALFLLQGGLGSLQFSAAKKTVDFSSRLVLSSLIFIAILVLANVVAARHVFFRWDSTEQKVYTLAPQTQQVLESLQQPVLVRAFYLGGRIDPKNIEDLLQRLAEHSQKFHWVAIDPEKQPTLTEKFGISQSGTLHFSFEHSDSSREVKLTRDISEQEIVNSILKLTRGGEKVVYNIVGHGEGDTENKSETGFLFLKEAIQGENITLKDLTLADTKAIPADASAVLLLAPKKALLENEWKILHDYIDNGGHAVLLQEPSSPDDIPRLAQDLGIEVGKNMVVDQAMRLFSGPSLGVQPMVTKYGKHKITENFSEGTVYSTAGSVRAFNPKPASALSGIVTELAFTSENSWAETNLDLLLGNDPQAALESSDIRGPVSIAAAFEGLSKDPKDSKKKTGRVVVFGDADFVANVNLRQLYNRDFFLNSLNWVIGEEQGVTIRSKTMRRSTKGLTVQQFSAMFALAGILLPEVLLLGGLAVWWKRRI